MSLSRHLRDPDSSVRAWFSDRLPHTAAIARDANLDLRGPRSPPDGAAVQAVQVVPVRSRTRPPLPSRARGAALAGTALDLFVRVTLAQHALQYSAAVTGAGRIVAGSGMPALDIECDAVQRIDDLRPWQRELDDGEWRELAGLCLLLARFEQAARSLVAREATIDQVKGVPPTVAGYRDALVNDDDLEDVCMVAPLIAADHSDLRAADRLAFGPAFALSRDLGGADADIIADGLLLDVKATSMPGIVTRSEIWQLLGYALADTDDAYRITEVGVSALRWRPRWVYQLRNSGQAARSHRAGACVE